MESFVTTQLAFPGSQACFFLFLVDAKLIPTLGLWHLLFSLLGMLSQGWGLSKNASLLERLSSTTLSKEVSLFGSLLEHYFAFFPTLCSIIFLLIYLLTYLFHFSPLGCKLHNRSDFLSFTSPCLHGSLNIHLVHSRCP